MTRALIPFKSRMLELREQAVIEVVYRLLASKGYDAMTVDEVAAEVGIAKASLYKHFASKEELACAAMVAAIEQAVDFLEKLNTHRPALALLQDAVRWVLQRKLNGEMPTLPARNSVLREQLMNSKPYMENLMQASEILGTWIERAQSEGSIESTLPSLLVLYTIYARACDPVLEFLHDSGLYSPEQIIDMVMVTCFSGLEARN